MQGPESLLGTKGSHHSTHDSLMGPQSYNHKELDFANSLNELESPELSSKTQGSQHLGFNLMEPGSEKPVK